MKLSLLIASIIAWWMACAGGAQGGTFAPSRKNFIKSEEKSKTTEPLGEPSCEELKFMWRFSKRQSKAAEVTNEIPTYKDPFKYNVWEPYYVSRLRSGLRHRGGPIYGRVVHKAPIIRVQDESERNRAFEEVARTFGTVQKQTEPRRKPSAFRLSGKLHMSRPQKGSFQHLKELIKTERARELQEQRRAEEMAARAAALKQLSGSGAFQTQANFRDLGYINREVPDEQREGFGVREGVVAFSDLFAPASYGDDDSMEDYYITDLPYKRMYSPTLHEPSSFNDELDEMML